LHEQRSQKPPPGLTDVRILQRSGLRFAQVTDALSRVFPHRRCGPLLEIDAARPVAVELVRVTERDSHIVQQQEWTRADAVGREAARQAEEALLLRFRIGVLHEHREQPQGVHLFEWCASLRGVDEIQLRPGPS
jgi:hypothetical protein